MDVVVSTMTTVRSEQLRYYRSVRGRDKVCVSLRKVQTASGAQPSTYSVGTAGLSSEE